MANIGDVALKLLNAVMTWWPWCWSTARAASSC
jgi:hypothetical protein